MERSDIMNKKKLTRSKDDKNLFGVIGGVAEYLDMDSTLLRFIFLLLLWALDGYLLVPYFIAAFIIPVENKIDEETIKNQEYVEKTKEAKQEDWSGF